jgi:hypothetical protein
VKSRRSWLVLIGVILALGGCTAYYAFLHDWRGSFTAEQLALEARVADRDLTLVMSNTGPNDLMIWDSPSLGGPFEITIEAAGGRPVRSVPGDQRSDRSRVLRRNAQYVWKVSLRSLFPDAAPGRYTLRAAYDPAAAAERGERCAAELTLGRVEVGPVEVTLPAGR